MVKVVQIAGDVAAIADAYTGPAREVRVDVSNWNLRLHDNATAGGHIILSKENSDARYQVKNPELGGIGPYDPAVVGYLTRVGSNSYLNRSIQVDTSALNITNPAGVAGNTTIALNNTITGDRLFQGVVQVNGGVNANTAGTHIGPVVGNVTGNTTGLHTGNVTGNLTGNSAGIHTGAVIGDVTGNVTGTVSGGISGNAATATKLQTARNIAISGDGAGTVAFDGSASVSINMTLGNTGPGAGSYTSPDVTIDAKGRVTALSSNTPANVPTGAIFWFVSNGAPAGYLKCDGAAVSRTTFAALNALASAAGYAAPWGAGNGSTTFNVPNLLGKFVRGHDSAGTTDPARTFGTLQTDAMQGHRHSPLGGINATAFNMHVSSGGGVSEAGGSATNVTGGTTTGDPTTDTTNGTPRTAAETRPVNVALLPMIKT